VRSNHNLQVIERDNLIANAATVGLQFLNALKELAASESIISGVRGRGLFLAFDLPDPKTRERFYEGLFDIGLLAIRCGERSIRFRPALDFPADAATAAMGMIREQCRRMKAGQGTAASGGRESKRELEGKAG